MGHEASQVKQRLFCPFDDCVHSFANVSKTYYVEAQGFQRVVGCYMLQCSLMLLDYSSG